jgi:hypothetical protein
MATKTITKVTTDELQGQIEQLIAFVNQLAATTRSLNNIILLDNMRRGLDPEALKYIQPEDVAIFLNGNMRPYVNEVEQLIQKTENYIKESAQPKEATKEENTDDEAKADDKE